MDFDSFIYFPNKLLSKINLFSLVNCMYVSCVYNEGMEVGRKTPMSKRN